jgi:hypothetical protein
MHDRVSEKALEQVPAIAPGLDKRLPAATNAPELDGPFESGRSCWPIF